VQPGAAYKRFTHLSLWESREGHEQEGSILPNLNNFIKRPTVQTRMVDLRHEMTIFRMREPKFVSIILLCIFPPTPEQTNPDASEPKREKIDPR
jgi:hypothetical protein